MSDKPVAFDPAVHMPAYQEGMDWFVLRVSPNKERSVQDMLLTKAKKFRELDDMGRVLVPTDKKRKLTLKGIKVTETLLYPGYVFVEMRLDNDKRIPQGMFFLIKETQGVTDFVGNRGRPIPMGVQEVDQMLFYSQRPETLDHIRSEFEKGDFVRIIKGPFEGTEGRVEGILADKGNVLVLAYVFQRLVPIEVEYQDIRLA